MCSGLMTIGQFPPGNSGLIECVHYINVHAIAKPAVILTTRPNGEFSSHATSETATCTGREHLQVEN